MPTPGTLWPTSRLSTSVASPASATAHSCPAGIAPFRAIWKGTLARVGSRGPVLVTIRSFAMAYPSQSRADRVVQCQPAGAGYEEGEQHHQDGPVPLPAFVGEQEAFAPLHLEDDGQELDRAQERPEAREEAEEDAHPSDALGDSGGVRHDERARKAHAPEVPGEPLRSRLGPEQFGIPVKDERERHSQADEIGPPGCQPPEAALQHSAPPLSPRWLP